MFGRLADGAPSALECTADASTTPRDVYSVLLTFLGATIAHMAKKIGCAVGSTYEAEGVASVKASELIVYARIVLKALGVDPHTTRPSGGHCLSSAKRIPCPRCWRLTTWRISRSPTRHVRRRALVSSSFASIACTSVWPMDT